METEKKQKKRRKWPLVLLVIVLLVGAVLAAAPYAVYGIAEEKFRAEDYDTAQLIYEWLGDFRDSPLRLQEIDRIRMYEKAGELLKTGDYDAAYAQFLSLGDYRDSRAMVTECTYQKAVSLLKWGNNVKYENIAQARELFLQLKDYKDSAVFLQQFQLANIGISRKYTQSGEKLATEFRWYDALGRLTGKGAEYDLYAYDDQDRLIRDEETQIEYDEEGRIWRETKDNRVITSTYGKDGKVSSRLYEYIHTSVTKKVFTEAKEHVYRYVCRYNGDLLEEETLYDNNVHWSDTYYSYDPEDRIIEKTVRNFGGRKYSEDYTYRYTYNEAGLLYQEERHYPNAANNYTDTYLYGYIWVPEAGT